MKKGTALPEKRRQTRSASAAADKALKSRRTSKAGGKTGQVKSARGGVATVAAAAEGVGGSVGGGGGGRGPPARVSINDALPEEVILLVLGKLSDLIDFLRAGCVCKVWHQLVASPSLRPPSPLWCIMILNSGRGLRSIDLNSGKEYKLETLATPRHPSRAGIKGQGGLIAFVDEFSDGGRGNYWIGNPLLNKWIQVPMIGCGGRFWRRGTSELVIDTAQEGSSSSYKLVRFMYTTPDGPGNKLRVDIYDSCSRVWTAGTPVHLPFYPVLDARFGYRHDGFLKSCVWRGRIYLLITPAKVTEFSIWEYNLEEDTLTMIVKLASLPMSLPEGEVWQVQGVFQVQVRQEDGHGSPVVELVVAGPSSSCIRYGRAVQVFVWDHSRELWVVKLEPEGTEDSDLTGNRFSFWSPAQEESVPGFLVRNRQRITCQAVAPGSEYAAISVCRTDTLAECHCKITTAVGDINAALTGHCFFPNFHDQP